MTKHLSKACGYRLQKFEVGYPKIAVIEKRDFLIVSMRFVVRKLVGGAYLQWFYT